MAKRHTFWDDPKYQRMLAELAAQEMYAKDIAAKMTKRFGFTITRNSVIGRASRTGIELSQPKKIERLRARLGRTLQEWMTDPENNAYRLERHRAHYLKQKSIDC